MQHPYVCVTYFEFREQAVLRLKARNQEYGGGEFRVGEDNVAGSRKITDVS